MSSPQTTHEYLKDIRNTNVTRVMRAATMVEPSYSLSKVIGMMSETDSFDVYCIDDGKVLTTNGREILSAKNIASVKISSLLHRIKPLSKTDTIEKAATAMSHYRMRSFPVMDGKKIMSVVTAKNIVNLLSRQNLNWIRANSVLTANPIVLSNVESLAKARKTMMTKRIDHIPIFHKGKIGQVLTSMHLLRLITPPERIGSDQKGVNPKSRFESDIGNIGSPRIPLCSTNDTINTVIDAMLKSDTTCCLLTLWENIHGIITYRDILDLISTKISSTVPLYIIGMPDDTENAEIVKTKFQKIISNLTKVYPEVEEAKTSIKTIHNPTSQRKHFEVSVRIVTPYKNYNYIESGWDLSKAFDALGKRIMKNLSNRSKKRWKTSLRKVSKREIF
ncbi:MAG: CBS domain-containing protein [Nitrosopumilaceae archaeon]